MISIKRGETSPFEASSRSFTSSISAFLAIRTFRPGSVYNPSRLFSSGRQAETALISLSSRSATSRDALFTATRRKKRFMILVSSLALVFLGSVAPLPQFPRGTFSPRALGKRDRWKQLFQPGITTVQSRLLLHLNDSPITSTLLVISLLFARRCEANDRSAIALDQFLTRRANEWKKNISYCVYFSCLKFASCAIKSNA